MSQSEQVKTQITDEITQVDTKIRGDAPAEQLGDLFQTLAHTVGFAMENAAAEQLRSGLLSQGATGAAARGLIPLEELSDESPTRAFRFDLNK